MRPPRPAARRMARILRQRVAQRRAVRRARPSPQQPRFRRLSCHS
ncbi:hypothetical protein BURPS305_2321 [Burkholderia pseudomallei 305]|nr:hypothetical protein BURPS305_2321 [Burkholderia pseudomallei 305]EDU10233.1 hypothetical protein BURPS1655_J0287 [Burkholderia pseudomallei 1655]EEP49561.1 hypothetical protein GBP346_B2370 [Burkholderia pseudomallei MSHR346]